jgi:hypothetical protein
MISKGLLLILDLLICVMEVALTFVYSAAVSETVYTRQSLVSRWILFVKMIVSTRTTTRVVDM